MTLATLKNNLHSALAHLYDPDEIEAFFGLLLEAFEQKTKINYVLNKEGLPQNKADWDAAILALKTGKPIQYVLGYAYFYGLKLMVNQHTLIPRPETEELVEWILETLGVALNNPQIIDLGTGSGCIAISLKKQLKSAQVTAVDISEKALEIAQMNAQNNTVDLKFLQQDILKPFNIKNTFEVIVSNPPYVKHNEKASIHQNVLNFEPHTALFVDDDNPLLFYDKIADFTKNHLSENGYLFFEINQYLGLATLALLRQKGFVNLELKKDFKGNDRMIRAQIKNAAS